jgi:hypothetical protein
MVEPLHVKRTWEIKILERKWMSKMLDWTVNCIRQMEWSFEAEDNGETGSGQFVV